MERICPNCGKELADGNDDCKYCGKKYVDPNNSDNKSEITEQTSSGNSTGEKVSEEKAETNEKAVNSGNALEKTEKSGTISEQTNEEKKNEIIVYENSPLVEGKTEVPKAFCAQCGTEISVGSNYCPNCGRDCAEPNITHCTNCGTPITKGLKFCSNCGNKVTFSTLQKKKIDNKFKAIRVKLKSAKVKKKLKTASIITAALVLAVTALIVCPKIFASTDTLLSQGKYEQAYKKAPKEKKKLVLFENLLACSYNGAKSELDAPSSYQMTGAWFDAGKDISSAMIVIKVSEREMTSDGTVNYFVYYYNDDSAAYIYGLDITDFDEESEDYYDYYDYYSEEFDYDAQKQAILLNGIKRAVKKIITNNKIKVNPEIINRIDGLDDEGLLEDVVLINGAESVYPNNSDKLIYTKTNSENFLLQ